MKTILFIAIAFLSFLKSSADDCVILRNGDEIEGKLLRTTESTVSFKVKKKVIDFKLEDVYAIKSEARGDIFFTRTGERRSMPQNDIPNSCDRIYLVDGGEIIAWGTSISGKTVSYRTSKDKQRALSSNQEIPLDEVFMVVYSDDSKDVINDVTMRQPEPEPKEEEQPVKPEQQLQVIFHNVVSGETVQSICARYNVNINDFRDWNDISPKLKDGQRLPAGQQMVIYTSVKPQ